MTRPRVSLAAAALLAGLPSACAWPPTAFQLATLMASGVSFATTGKDVSDHAISMVAGEDCATFRLIAGDPVCSPHDDAVAVVVPVAATDEPLPVAPAVAN